MRISDWSSDVCSSDLVRIYQIDRATAQYAHFRCQQPGYVRSNPPAYQYTTSGIGDAERPGYSRSVARTFRNVAESGTGCKALCLRTADRRVGNEWVSTGRSRWAPYS